MKLYIFSLLSTFSLSKSEQLTQTGLILQHYGSTLLNSILNSVGYAQEDSEAIASHGCWCGKLDLSNHPFPEVLGGSQPFDELDEICRDWFMCRHCNDRLSGGSCNYASNEAGLTSRQYLLSGEYTMAINETYFDNSVCVTASDTCSDDTCVIDLYYANKIVEYYDNTFGAFNTTVIVDEGICASSTNNHEEKTCQGTAPYLNIVKTPPGEPAISAEQVGILTGDGWSQFNGTMNGDTHTLLYKTFTDYKMTYFGAVRACLDLNVGATLASITSEEELEFVKSSTFKEQQNYIPGYYRLGARENENEDGVFYWELNENIEENQEWTNSNSAGSGRSGEWDTRIIYLDADSGINGQFSSDSDIVLESDSQYYMCQIRKGEYSDPNSVESTQLTLSNARWADRPTYGAPGNAIDGLKPPANTLINHSASNWSPQNIFIADIPNNAQVASLQIYPRQYNPLPSNNYFHEFERYADMVVKIDDHVCTTEQSLEPRSVWVYKQYGIVYDCGNAVGSELVITNGNLWSHYSEIMAFGFVSE